MASSATDKLKEIDFETDSDEVNFDLEHKALGKEKIANVSIHEIVEGTRADIESLLKNNAEIKMNLLTQEIASNQRWSKIKHESATWEQIASWTLISVSLVGSISLAIWITRIQIKLWKNEGNEGFVWNEEKEKEILKNLRTHASNIVTDAQIKVREMKENDEEEVNDEPKNDVKVEIESTDE